MEAWDIILHFYPEETPLRRRLWKHSNQVMEKAISLMAHSALHFDESIVRKGALLHDVGILRCHAPKILCYGEMPYLAHGLVGAEMLRAYAKEVGEDWEVFARICERHTGAGITKEDILARGLPLPPRDFLPETAEERLVCYADKFFSKSGDMQEENLAQIRREMVGYGGTAAARFDALEASLELQNRKG